MAAAGYRSDLSDKAWALMEQHLPAAKSGGRPTFARWSTPSSISCEAAANGACCRTIFRPRARSGGIFGAGVLMVSGRGFTGASMPRLGKRRPQASSQRQDRDSQSVKTTERGRSWL